MFIDYLLASCVLFTYHFRVRPFISLNGKHTEGVLNFRGNGHSIQGFDNYLNDSFSWPTKEVHAAEKQT